MSSNRDNIPAILKSTEGHTPDWKSENATLYATIPSRHWHGQEIDENRFWATFNFRRDTPQKEQKATVNLALNAPALRAEVIRLQAELAATAETARGLREALDGTMGVVKLLAMGLLQHGLDFGEGGAEVEHIIAKAASVATAEPTAAEVQARENAEKAALWDESQAFGLADFLRRQQAFSSVAFGPGKRTKGLTDHIRKELLEIEADPTDLTEFIDVILLAFDGWWRHGGTPEGLPVALEAKLAKNKGRKWPTPTSEDHAVEHDRTQDAIKGGAA